MSDRSDDHGVPLRTIHVPQDTDVVLVVTSVDYIYTLALKQQGIREVAVPGLDFCVEFPQTQAGTYDLAGDEMCGDPHAELQGHLVVEPREQFLEWLSETSAGAAE